MSAHRACRDIECRADILVRFPHRDHAGDLELAPGETGHSRCSNPWRRARAQLPYLFTNVLELTRSSKPRERLMGNAELVQCSIPVPILLVRLRKRAAHSRRLVGQRNLLEGSDRRLKKRNRCRRVTVPEETQHSVSKVSHCHRDGVSELLAIESHSHAMFLRALEIPVPESCLANNGQHPLKAPRDVSALVGKLERRFTKAYRFIEVVSLEMIRSEPHV